VVGVLAGLGVGLILARQLGLPEGNGLWWQRALRLLVGVVVLYAIRLGLKAAFPGEDSALYLLFRFVRYSVIGFWISLGAPWLFRLLRLSPKADALAIEASAADA
jgi:hypothetical protein